AQLLFGRSVISIRLLACVAAASSAFLLFRMGGSRARSDRLGVGLLAALLYLVHSTGNNGIAANTEVFYTPFVLGGFWLALRRGFASPSIPAAGQSFAIGLLFGVGIQIKYVVVFDFAAAVLILTHQIWLACRAEGRSFVAPTLRAWLLLAVGVVAPFAVVYAYFAGIGHSAEVLRRNVQANLVNRSDTRFSLVRMFGALKEQLLNFPLLWLPLPLLAYLWQKNSLPPRERRMVSYAATWLLFAMLGVSFTKLF